MDPPVFCLLLLTSTFSVLFVNSLGISIQSTSRIVETLIKEKCPRKEDIHPCECLEIPTNPSEDSPAIETVAFCKTIRNVQVLQNAMKGMQGYTIDFMVLDSCKLPPFPNGLFYNINIKWMEIINSTIQVNEGFFNCASNCW